jgi:ferredoxin
MGHRVRIEPLGVDLFVAEGESLLQAAKREGYQWPSRCGGKAECSTCFVRVVEGLEHLTPVSPREQECLAHGRGVDATRQVDVRLACQLRVAGTVRVRKLGVRAGR